MIVLRILTVIIALWHNVNSQDPADYPIQVPGTCGSISSFDCGSGNGGCIAVSKIRDCVADCTTGSDEYCGNGYVLCDKMVGGCSTTGCGKCVKSNVTGSQCFDQRYTIFCDNSTVYPFKCRTTTNCLSLNWLMDGNDDCGDSSDEDPCFTRDLLAANGRTVKCDPIATCNYTACPTAILQCTCPVGYTGPSSSCQLLANLSTTSAQTTVITTKIPTTATMTSTVSATTISSTKNSYPTATTTTIFNATGTTVATCAAYCKNAALCLTEGQLMNSVDDCGDNSDEDLCYLGRTICSSTKTCEPLIAHKTYTCSIRAYNDDCSDLLIRYKTNITDGVYPVTVSNTCDACRKLIYCDFNTYGGGWTVDNYRLIIFCRDKLLDKYLFETIMRRQDGSERFYGNWSYFANGFGTVSNNTEFWIGNDYLSKITAKSSLGFELLVQMVTAAGVPLFARYEPFVVGRAVTNYRLTIGKMTSGNADDDLSPLNNQMFQTWDRKTTTGQYNCAGYRQGAWWFTSDCGNGSSRGDLGVPYEVYAQGLNGIQWSVAGVPTRLKTVEMKIRPLTLTQGSSTIIPPVPHAASHFCYSVAAIVFSVLILYLVQ